MSSNHSIRASDRDRDRTADLLREHHAAGRLDPAEFNERLDKAFAARTLEELDQLTADLPAIDLYPLPTASLPRNRIVNRDLPAASVFSQGSGPGSGLGSGQIRIWRGSGRLAPGWLVAWASWSVITLLSLIAWVLSGDPWPVLVLGGVGVIMGARWVVGPRALGRGRGHGGKIGTSSADQIEGTEEDG
jgi:hypothetical protein